MRGAIAGVAAAAFLLPIPGLNGRSLQIVGALRTNDGGGIVAARLPGRLVTARLQFDGALDLGYGREGAATVSMPRGFGAPTGLAIDPSSGAAWIGGAGGIVALDGSGRPRRSFGRRSELPLRASGPLALTYGGGELLVAAGDGVSLRDAASGRLLRSATLPPGPGGCTAGNVTAAVFAPGGGELVSTAGGGCGGAVLALGPGLRAAPGPGPGQIPGATVSDVSGGPGGACVSSLAGSRWSLEPFGGRTVTLGTGLRAGAVVATTPLGAGACAALLRADAGRPARVVQVGSGGAGASVTPLPRGLSPLAMFRCHAHVLVIGSRRSGRDEQAEIFPVAVRRGPFAAAASAARATTGCSARAATPAFASAPAAAAPTLTLALHKSLGYLDAQVSGPAGTAVDLAELVPGATAQTLTGTTIPASGTVTVSHLTPWQCADRTPTIQASAADGSAAPATATVTTPACTDRLHVTAPPGSVRAGARLALHIADRWRLGGFSVTLCSTPPAEPPACRSVALPAGGRATAVPVSLLSPGLWRFRVRAPWRQIAAVHVGAEHPGGRLELLATGDSEIQEVDTDLADGLAARHVHVDSEARVGTGISKVAQLDWVRHAAVQASRRRPDVTVVFIGANDGFDLPGASGRPVACCGGGWIGLFAHRAAAMMRAYERGGRGRVLWFTLPIARDAGHAALFRAVDRAYELAAGQAGPGVQLVRADRIFTPGGRYRQTLDVHGHQVDVRAPDGIHLSPAGAQIAAAAVIVLLRRDGLLSG